MNDQTEGRLNAAKAGAAWLSVGAVSTWDWGTIAAVLAALYTVLLIVEWVWKRIGRPIAEARGWVKPRRRRRSDDDDTDRGDL